jgi:hypothetical protein
VFEKTKVISADQSLLFKLRGFDIVSVFSIECLRLITVVLTPIKQCMSLFMFLQGAVGNQKSSLGFVSNQMLAL